MQIVTSNKKFQPIHLTITLESQEEVNHLFALCQTGSEQIINAIQRCNRADLKLDIPGLEAVTTPIFEALNPFIPPFK